jgi:AcrR family transcriptional regulator
MARQACSPEETPETRSPKAITQDRILSAAMGLFLRRGYQRTSVSQIAKKAGVSRAAVFWHFGNKTTLFRAACKQFVVPFRAALGGRLSHLEPRKRLRELTSVYERFVLENQPNIVAFVRWVLDSPEHAQPLRDELLGLHEAFRTEVEAALLELLDDPAEASARAAGLISLLDGNLFLSIFGSEPGAAERYGAGLRLVSELILGGRRHQ